MPYTIEKIEKLKADSLHLNANEALLLNIIQQLAKELIRIKALLSDDDDEASIFDTY